MDKELSANSTISHYRIVSKLGAGGMGEVFLAEDTHLRRRVALKVLPKSVSADADRLLRFKGEAFAASALNHPNILTIFEFGLEDDRHFLAAEFVDGESLGQRLTRSNLTIPEILEIAIQMASALHAAHEAGIIHRDIKPDNVMIRADGYVKILDFGLAKLSQSRHAGIATASDPEAQTRLQVQTQAGIIIGTVAYMSPEQARGHKLDRQTDIWSLGCVLYEMLIKQQPFRGDTTTDVLANIIHRDPVSVASLRPDVNAELERIVARTLNKNKTERYQTASDLLVDLKQLQKRLEFEAELERSTSPDQTKELQTQIILPQTTPDQPSPNQPTSEGNESPTAILASGTISGPDPSVSPEFRGTTSTGSTDGRQNTPATAAGVASTARAGALNTTSSAEYIVSGIKQHKVAALVIAVVLAVAAVALTAFRGGNAGVSIDSIAVLPFENRSADAETEYLSDGLAESLIYRLSQLPNLRVTPTSLVFRYKGKQTDAAKAGNELGVNAVLVGRITQRADNLTISAELIDVRHNKLLWGEQYDRKMSDLLATQREIAREIVENLKLKVSGEEKGLAKQYTKSNEAYQLHLKGRFYWGKRNEDAMQKSIEYFQQAIDKDPSFALAYTGLADAYILMGASDASGAISAHEALPKAKAAALKALEIDDTLAEPHVSLAHVKYYYDRDWAAAEREYKRAIELNPNYSIAHQWYAIYLMSVGRFDEALAQAKRAQELDPLSLPINMTLGWVLLNARQYDQSVEQLSKTLEMDPSFILTHHRLGMAYEQQGKYDEAIAEFTKVINLSGRKPMGLAALARAYALSGKQVEAQKILAELQELSKKRFVSEASIAMVYIALGDKEQAFAWLEKADEARDALLARLKVDPRFDRLRSDPRFDDFVRRVGLPQ